MNARRLLSRSLYYFREGQGKYLAFPLSFVGFVSTVYYLAIQNVPFLANIFPRFHYFIMFMVIVVPPLGVLLGWMHFKGYFRSLYVAERDIGVEADPYSYMICNPQNAIFYHIVSQLARQHGIDTTKLDEIIKRSEQKFGVKVTDEV